MTRTGAKQAHSIFRRFANWFRNDILGLMKEMRLSYVPPLMVYFAAGVSGFTGIIESFFVKEQLGLSAAFLAGLLGGVHCVGMCGGIVGALSFGARQERRLPILFAYNFGRVASYTLAGALLVGTAGYWGTRPVLERSPLILLRDD